MYKILDSTGRIKANITFLLAVYDVRSSRVIRATFKFQKRIIGIVMAEYPVTLTQG